MSYLGHNNWSELIASEHELILSGCDLFQFSLDELNSMPIAMIELTIHFQEDDNGDNFTCDPNDPIINRPGVQDLIFAPLFAEKLIYHMNDKLDEGLWINGQQYDTRIRVKLYDESNDCSSLFFYNANNPYQPVSYQ